MRQATAKRTLSGALALLMAFLLLFTSLTPAYALENKQEATLEITGSTKRGTFKLDSSDLSLFSLTSVAPGDSWDASIRVVNKAAGTMYFRILEIQNNIEDDLLFNALDLEIDARDKEPVYEGKYGKTEKPVSNWYRLGSGRDMYFDVDVGASVDLTNEYQGKMMDSTWIFEATYEPPEDDDDEIRYFVYYVDEETGEELAKRKIGYGEHGERITEYAKEIPGYTPDAEKKSMVIYRYKINKMYFYYTNENTIPVDPEPDDPVDPVDPVKPTPEEPGPADPPKEPEKPNKDVIQTGFDFAQSNTGLTMTFVLLFLAAIGGGVTYLRIQAIRKQQRRAQDSPAKEETKHEK